MISYDTITQVYENIIREAITQEMISKDPRTGAVQMGPPAINHDKLRNGLVNLVHLLRLGHSEGIVESIDDLPTPAEVRNFSDQQIMQLNFDLTQRYFPTFCDSEAELAKNL